MSESEIAEGVLKNGSMLPLVPPSLWMHLTVKLTLLGSIVVICSFLAHTCYTIFFTRFPHHPWPWPFPRRQEIHQTPAQLPFTFKILDSTANLMEQFKFQLTCSIGMKIPKDIILLWGVDVNYLFKLINTSSWESLTDLSNASSMKNDDGEDHNNGAKPYLHVERLGLMSQEDTLEYTVTVDSPRELKWEGLSNQYKYPLAIFILKSPDDDNDIGMTFSTEPTIVGICAILHVKNPLIPRPTTVLGQYIKVSNGHAHHLQSLYVNGLEPDPTEEIEADENQTTNNAQNNEPFKDILCTVCQSLPVSRAIIPCRHVCLCARCFDKMNTCPICRGAITCYFKTRNERYMDTNDATSI